MFESKLLSILTALPLLGFGLIEELFPRRTSKAHLRLRWTTNFSLLAIDTYLTRWLLPINTIGMAAWAHTQDIGLLNQFDWHPVAELLLGFLLWDFSGFVLHRLSHSLPWLWDFHKVHHCDMEFDVSTSVRHHPFEALLDSIWDVGTVVCLGIEPHWLIICQTAQFFSGTFNHANIQIPLPLDRWLRWVIVTPDMHRIHHSCRYPETDRNFGNLLACWDRLFASYLETPQGGHLHMSLGLNEFSSVRQQTMWQQLVIPFSRKKPPDS